jgi:hypothetical protein
LGDIAGGRHSGNLAESLAICIVVQNHSAIDADRRRDGRKADEEHHIPAPTTIKSTGSTLFSVEVTASIIAKRFKKELKFEKEKRRPGGSYRRMTR